MNSASLWPEKSGSGRFFHVIAPQVPARKSMNEVALRKFSMSRDELVSVLRVMTHNLWWLEGCRRQEDIPDPDAKDLTEGGLCPGFSALSQEELESLLTVVMDRLWNRIH